jgi:cbb3-type cytochrome oxidase cytochrome c subunit
MQIGKGIKIILLVSSLFLLLANSLIVHKNQKADWIHYQEEYLKLVLSKTQDAKMRELLKNRPVRIEQKIITQFGKKRVERCTTCHAGIDDPRFAKAPSPFGFHPKLKAGHSFAVMGCTVCHAGNGRGLSVKDAHGNVAYWTELLLKKNYLEAGCAKCHQAPYLSDMTVLRKGAKLFKTKACYGCHKIEGVSNGKLGVELTIVGAKWPIEYIEESIVKPKANNFESIMPKMELTKDEVLALVVYLKSLTGENLAEGPVAELKSLKKWKALKPKEVALSAESGKNVFQKKSCTACHTINSVGGKIGPDLSVYGLQRTHAWIVQHHFNPRSLIGGSIMPDFQYSNSEMEALALYLSALK